MYERTLQSDVTVLPLTDRQSVAETIGNVFAACEQAAKRREHAEVLILGRQISLFVNRQDADNPRLLAIRLWMVDALLNLGRGTEALALLGRVEAFNGPSFETRERLALVRLYHGDYDGCVTACEDAMLSAPLTRTSSRDHIRLSRLRVEAMCLGGRREEARCFLLETLRGVVPTAKQLTAFRQTIDSPSALESFFVYLSPHFVYPGHRARHALLQFSIACRDAGNMDQAIFAARQRFLAGLKIVAFGSRPAADKQGWVKDASGALVDLRADFATIGVEFFLISGTMLGCVREGGIIGHDKDIDVGVITETPLDAIRQALITSGRFKPKRTLSTDNLIQVEHVNGVTIDVFKHWREDGRIYHEGQKARWWNSEFDLKEVDFLGHSFYIPTDADRYLTENYGSNWSVPQPDFETFVDTPNMIAQDDQHMIWYYYTKLHDYYYEGKPIQLSKVWRALKSAAPYDSAVEAAMAQVLSSADIEVGS